MQDDSIPLPLQLTNFDVFYQAAYETKTGYVLYDWLL